MSWDPAYSFGTPNAQPPTPTQTPTAGQFSTSPTFETPSNNTSFESRGGWTPTFAEEYSVFHATPGRLVGDENSFLDTTTAHQLDTTGHDTFGADISAEFASSTHHLSPNIRANLDNSDQPSQFGPSTIASAFSRFDDSVKNKVTPRRPRKRLEESFSGQTATPPQSATKGSRKLAPKISVSTTMQNKDHDNGLYGMSATPTHNSGFSAFPSTSTDLYDFPMSAPATAPVFSDSKPFWDPDASLNAMDLDFGAHELSMFNTGHRISNSLGWGRSNQMIQEVNIPAPAPTPSAPSTRQPAKRQRTLAPKAAVPAQVQKSLPPLQYNSTTATASDPFNGLIDPGLVYSRSNSINVPTEHDDVSLPAPRPATSRLVRKPYQHQQRESRRDQEEICRSRSTRERSSGTNFRRETVSSPVKGSARPGLSRSMSDGKLKRSQSRPVSRPRRASPVKGLRSSVLRPILESPQPGPRTEVRFTIDANGKARTETVIVGSTVFPSKAESMNEHWESSQYESSSDEELIIVSSRNTSFNLPTQPKGPKMAKFNNHLYGSRRQSSSGEGYSRSESSLSQHSTQMDLDGAESEAETVMDEANGSGDATRELRKVMENRKRMQQQKASHHHHYLQDPHGSYYSNSANLSPTTISDPDGTPTSSRGGSTRCVCGKPEDERFMIQCESCENWLHAECVNLSRRSVPAVYICRFCANTPNLRHGRVRDSARAHGSSPLAHKSFKSFR
ncbi:hypothetical protein BJ878DRAFT_48284 [Calycina marina]|uniref:PHD-type domain-containing protein n=1 Tax=Calycina marina TaxID=1763456 RepID=A0A9P7Z3T9_9HELO|nr:hypothetical protein BJ878DRAFT_48284 [Calycina marina]